MCQDNYRMSEALRTVTTMQIATFVACAVVLVVSALMDSCTCERLARIEAKLDVPSMMDTKKKGE